MNEGTDESKGIVAGEKKGTMDDMYNTCKLEKGLRNVGARPSVQECSRGRKNKSTKNHIEMTHVINQWEGNLKKN